jgi:hypothetical protein
VDRADTDEAFQKREKVRHFNKKWKEEKEMEIKNKEKVENSTTEGDIQTEITEVEQDEHGS